MQSHGYSHLSSELHYCSVVTVAIRQHEVVRRTLAPERQRVNCGIGIRKHNTPAVFAVINDIDGIATPAACRRDERGHMRRRGRVRPPLRIIRNGKRPVRPQIQLAWPTLKNGQPIWSNRLPGELVNSNHIRLLRLRCNKQLRRRYVRPMGKARAPRQMYNGRQSGSDSNKTNTTSHCDSDLRLSIHDPTTI